MIEMAKELGLGDLGDKNLSALQQIAKELEVSNYRTFRKNDLVFKILETQAQKNGLLFRFCSKNIKFYTFFC